MRELLMVAAALRGEAGFYSGDGLEFGDEEAA